MNRSASLDDPFNSRLVTFTVLEALKGGSERGTIEVRTAGSAAACGLTFVVGREYVVYAYADADGRLATGRCTRTRSIEDAHGDVAYARTIASGGEPLGRITGRVVLRFRDLARARSREEPMRGVDVILRRNDGTVRATTDATGGFSVEGLEAGFYAASVDVSESFDVEMAPGRIDLADARGCAVAEAVVHPDGRIRGRVVEANGRPIEGLTLELAAAASVDASRSSAGERLRAVTRRDGSYEFSRVPPGRFVVGINTDTSESAEPLVLHPGVFDASQAARVNVTAGERVDAGTFVIPASAGVGRITGVVVDAAGAPAEGARVYLRGPAERDYIVAEPVTADFVGRFTIAAVLDREYRVFAERDRPGDARGRIDVSDAARVMVSPHTPPLRLTLRRQ